MKKLLNSVTFAVFVDLVAFVLGLLILSGGLSWVIGFVSNLTGLNEETVFLCLGILVLVYVLFALILTIVHAVKLLLFNKNRYK